jgi:hypothetical protein
VKWRQNWVRQVLQCGKIISKWSIVNKRVYNISYFLKLDPLFITIFQKFTYFHVSGPVMAYDNNLE